MAVILSHTITLYPTPTLTFTLHHSPLHSTHIPTQPPPYPLTSVTGSVQFTVNVSPRSQLKLRE